MATYIRKLKDLDGSYVLPATRSTAIYMSNNQKLEDYLSDMEDDLMSQISSGSVDFSRATASTSDVLSGETFYAGNKTLKTGTLSLTATAGTGDVLQGKTFFSGNSTRKTGTLSLTASATAADVRVGRTFFAGNSTRKTGTMPVRSAGEAKTINLWTNSAGTKYIQANTIQEGYYESNGEDYSPQINIPATLFGNAVTSEVLSGKTFTSNSGAALRGSMTNRGAWNGTVNPGSSITIPAGYHNGSGKVTANNPSGNWQMRFVSPNADNVDRQFTFDLPDGAGTYGWGCTGYIYWGNENSGLHFVFADANYPLKLGNGQSFTFHGTANLAEGYNNFSYRCYGGAINFYYCRIR